MPIHSVRSAALVLTLALAGAGCGGHGKLVPAEGIVTLDGQPLENATVVFLPLGAGGQQASGRTDDDGTFRLTTFKPDDGAWPGEYKIVVTKVEALSLPGGAPPKDGVQGLELMRKMMKPPEKGKKAAAKAKSPIPAYYQDEAKTPLRAQIPSDGKIPVKLKSSSGL